jgi:hypothetical protein
MPQTSRGVLTDKLHDEGHGYGNTTLKGPSVSNYGGDIDGDVDRHAAKPGFLDRKRDRDGAGCRSLRRLSILRPVPGPDKLVVSIEQLS